jgi:hypothetical protein
LLTTPTVVIGTTLLPQIGNEKKDAKEKGEKNVSKMKTRNMNMPFHVQA